MYFIIDTVLSIKYTEVETYTQKNWVIVHYITNRYVYLTFLKTRQKIFRFITYNICHYVFIVW